MTTPAPKTKNRILLRTLLTVLVCAIGIFVVAGINSPDRTWFFSQDVSTFFSDNETDQKILSWEFADVSWNPVQDEQTAALESGLVTEIMSLTGEKGLLQVASGMHILYAKHQIFTDIYERTQRHELLPYLIEYAIQSYSYAQANDYLIRMQELDPELKQMDPKRFLFLIINTVDLNFKNIADIKHTIERFYQQKKIDTDTYVFYDAVITFAKKDIQNYSYFMDKLQQSPVYSWWYRWFQEDKNSAAAYQDVPEYYLQTLVALRFLQQWYPNVAKTATDLVLQQDEKYILAHQVSAYSSLLLWKRTESQQEFERLISLDAAGKDMYLFYKWVALYMAGQYDTAVLSFTQVRDQWLMHDTLRYVLLSYAQLEDWSQRRRVAQRLAMLPSLDMYDYFTIFDTLFFADTQMSVQGTYDDNQLRTLLLTCYERLPKDLTYVCLYGKAGYFLQQGDEMKSYHYLEQLVNRYPLPEIYEKLWAIAHRQGLVEEAKRWYAKAILSSSDPQQTMMLKWLFSDLVRN